MTEARPALSWGDGVQGSRPRAGGNSEGFYLGLRGFPRANSRAPHAGSGRAPNGPEPQMAVAP